MALFTVTNTTGSTVSFVSSGAGAVSSLAPGESKEYRSLTSAMQGLIDSGDLSSEEAASIDLSGVLPEVVTLDTELAAHNTDALAHTNGAMLVGASQMTSVKTVSYAIQPADVYVLVDIAAADMDLQLPDPAAGRRIIKIINTTPGGYGTYIHIKRHGSEKIGGAAADFNMWSNFHCGTLVSDLTNWFWLDIFPPTND